MDENTVIILAVAGLMLLHLAIGVPLFVVLGLGSMAMILGCDVYSISVFGEVPFSAIDSWALLAMPLFILTGDLINRSGIARRLSDFAYALLGWLRGGLAMASLGACGLFAAISGSNSATTATIGSMLHPEMVKGGYDERFSAATAAAGGTVGIIIPPNHPSGFSTGLISPADSGVLAQSFGTRHRKAVQNLVGLSGELVATHRGGEGRDRHRHGDCQHADRHDQLDQAHACRTLPTPALHRAKHHHLHCASLATQSLTRPLCVNAPSNRPMTLGS